MVLPCLLLAAGGSLLAQGAASVLGQIGLNLLAGGAQQAFSDFLARVNSDDHDLRRLFVHSLEGCARKGAQHAERHHRPDERRVYDRLKEQVQSCVPPERGDGWNDWIRVLVAGNPEEIGALAAACLSGEDLPPGGLEAVLPRLGDEFRAELAGRMKDKQYEKGFHAFLQESLWLLHQRPVQNALPPDLAQIAENLQEVPDLTPALDAILAQINEKLGRLQEEVTQIRETTNESKEMLIQIHEKLDQISGQIALKTLELHENTAGQKVTSDFLSKPNEPTLQAPYASHLEYLQERELTLGREVAALQAELNEALRQLASLEPDAVRKQALELELAGKFDEADITYTEARLKLIGSGRRQLEAEVDLGLEHMAAWGRQGDINRAISIWRELTRRDLIVLPDRIVNAGNRMTEIARTFGIYDIAVEVGTECLKFSREHLNDATLTSANELGCVYLEMGRYADAQLLIKESLDRSIELLGSEDPDTLTSVSNLAACYYETGRYDLSLSLFERVFEVRMRISGEKDHVTLTSMQNLASQYEKLGRYKQAEQLFKQALRLRRDLLGEEDPQTLDSLGGLAVLYASTKRYREAERMLQKVIKLTIRVLGPEHPDTIRRTTNLANVYLHTGRAKQAKRLLKSVIPLTDRLPMTHPARKLVEFSIQKLDPL